MTFADPMAGLLVAALVGLCMAAAYVLYRMTREGVDGLTRLLTVLKGDRRGERR